MDEYTRDSIEERHGKLTDKQWEILVAEVENMADGENIDDVIADVYEFMDDYEAEYSFWKEYSESPHYADKLEILMKKYSTDTGTSDGLE